VEEKTGLPIKLKKNKKKPPPLRALSALTR
jgi:hypothetical protein